MLTMYRSIMKSFETLIIRILFPFTILLAGACQQKVITPNATAYITSMDQSRILQKLPGDSLIPMAGATATITLDTAITYQEMDGFGYTLTGGSAPASYVTGSQGCHPSGTFWNW